jgi:hypothetical protein
MTISPNKSWVHVSRARGTRVRGQDLTETAPACPADLIVSHHGAADPIDFMLNQFKVGYLKAFFSASSSRIHNAMVV